MLCTKAIMHRRRFVDLMSFNESTGAVVRCFFLGTWLLAGVYQYRFGSLVWCSARSPSRMEEQPARIPRRADCSSGAEDAATTEPNEALLPAMNALFLWHAQCAWAVNERLLLDAGAPMAARRRHRRDLGHIPARQPE